jgi:outer membrane protein OmpA-like peptidoglycan-associated protein
MDLEIVGHADSSEPEQLGIARARRVLHALVARGLSPARFQASSEGTRRPAVESKSAEGRAKNRRVEFVLRGPKRPLDAP